MEKLPYYARMLKKETPKLKPKPARDAELFSFAKKNGWAKKLDPKDLELMRTVIADYDAALHRIRVSRIKTKQMKRYSDIQKILFMRGQDRSYTPDELYGAFQDATADRIHTIRDSVGRAVVSKTTCPGARCSGSPRNKFRGVIYRAPPAAETARHKRVPRSKKTRKHAK